MMKKIKLGLLALLIGGVAFGAANRVWESQEWLSGHITTPSNPSAGKTKMYFKSDNKLYKLTSGGVETEVGAGSGDLVGPASSTDEAVCRFDGTTGKLAQNSVVGISDTGAVTGVTSLSLSGAISGGTTFSGTGATLSGLTASRALTTDGSKNLASSAVTSTELGYVSGVTSAIQTQIDGKQATDSDLTAVAGLSTTGLVARTGAGTASTRTVTGTANQITVTNGDGVSGNPTVSIPSNPVLPGTGHSVNGISYLTGTDDPTATATSAAAGSLYTNTTTGTIYRKTDAGSSTNWSIIGTSAAITAPTAYTPTYGAGLGTVTNNSAYYMQIGSTLYMWGFGTTGTATTSAGSISIPSVCTLDTSKLVASAISNPGSRLGSWSQNAAGTSGAIVSATSTSTTNIYIAGNTGSTSGLSGSASISTTSMVSSTSFAWNATIPCSNLASVVNTATTPIITAYQSWTPTLTGFGTTSGVTGKYHQVGNEIEFEVTWTNGSPTGGGTTLSMTTPGSCTTASDYPTLAVVGHGATSASLAGSYQVLAAPSEAVLYFGVQQGAAGGVNKAVGNNVSSAAVMSFKGKVRCAGMPGVIPAPNLVGFTTNNSPSAMRLEAFNATGTCTVTETGSSDWINGNGSNPATGRCIYTVNSGIFSGTPSCVCTSKTGTAICSYDDAFATSTSIPIQSANSAGALGAYEHSVMCMGPR